MKSFDDSIGLLQSLTVEGFVTSVEPPIVKAHLPLFSIGDSCSIETSANTKQQGTIIKGDRTGEVTISCFNDLDGIRIGSEVKLEGGTVSVPVGSGLIGRVIDSLGQPIDGKGDHANYTEDQSIFCASPKPFSRVPISRQFVTGVRVVDSVLPLGAGQRVLICAPAGCGKSSFIEMLVNHSEYDVAIVALVGERGREVTEFISHLPQNVLGRIVVVASTSDETAARRKIAPYTATTIAEYFRDKGMNVLLLVDSLTRTARAIREVGMAAGEIPLRGGFTPSVYSELPKLFERAGATAKGTITACYSLLDTSADEILVEEIKSLVDGHFVLSKDLAERSIYPAIDVGRSLSRVDPCWSTADQKRAGKRAIRYVARLAKDQDALVFGGTLDEELEAAVTFAPKWEKFIEQSREEKALILDSNEKCKQLFI